MRDYVFPSTSPVDPARAVADLVDTVPLVDDLIAVAARLNPAAMTDTDLEDWHTVRRELFNLRRRIETIASRLVAP